jgi:hypothetical protein
LYPDRSQFQKNRFLPFSDVCSRHGRFLLPQYHCSALKRSELLFAGKRDATDKPMRPPAKTASDVSTDGNPRPTDWGNPAPDDMGKDGTGGQRADRAFDAALPFLIRRVHKPRTASAFFRFSGLAATAFLAVRKSFRFKKGHGSLIVG